MRLQLVGTVRMLDQRGDDCTPRSAKARAVLAMLTSVPERRRSRRWLESRLWSDRGADQAAGSLRQALMQIRRALGEDADRLCADREAVWVDGFEPDSAADRDASAQGREYLEGGDIPDPAFEDWLRQERAIRAPSRAQVQAADLAALEPNRVTRIEGDVRVSCPVDEVARGDTLWLAAGSRVPVDGVLCADTARVDRSALTGESDAITVEQDANLTAGEVLLTGPVTIRTTVAAKGSTLRRLVQLASVAEGARSRYTSLANRAAGVYAPLVHGLSFVAFIAWSVATGDYYHALTIAIATLIITCPCALGLAVPAVATVATGRLFRMGVLVKSETALERLAEVDTVVFDKTGTLTDSALVPGDDLSGDHRAVLKALAEAANHPLSRSVLPALNAVRAAPLSALREHRGKGVTGHWGDFPVALGDAGWIGQGDGTVLQVGSKVFALDRREQAVPEAGAAVAALREMGLDVHMLTGDTPHNAARMAETLELDHVHAGVGPEDKQALITDLQASGRKVVMIGDGLNDTLALTQAWASIAPGTALEASQNAADVVLLGQKLSGIPAVLRIARSARRRILENFGLAACYNAVAIPLALMGYATPLMAALAMSTSSITVTLNALRTR